MFNTLESTWDRSARRGWTTLASFGFQAMALSLLLLMPLIWIQGPPKLQWFEAPPAPAPPVSGQRPMHSSNISNGHVQLPTTIPDHVADLYEQRCLP